MATQKRKWELLSKEEQINILNNSSNFTQICKNFGYTKASKPLIRDIRLLAKELNYDLSFVEYAYQAGSRLIDLRNKKFNLLQVIDIDYEKSKSNKDTYWRCICECGKECSYSTSVLKSLKVKSCGHLRTDTKYQKFTAEEQKIIIEQSRDYTEIARKFGYQHLGFLTAEKIHQLAINIGADDSKAMTNYKRGPEYYSIIGQKFNHLTVVEEAKEYQTNGHTKWKCICDCGNPNFIITEKNTLITGKIISCGCHLIKDLKHQQFGFLEPIRIDWNKTGPTRMDKNAGNGAYWLCKCHLCNREDLVSKSTKSLTQGESTNCGCARRSNGELKIYSILTELNLKFSEQKTFYGLVGKGNQPLSYDFYLNYNNKEIAIEYQGEQHYIYNNFFYNDIKEFEYRKELDEKKRNYCKENNIELIEIPYTDYLKIDTQYLLNKLNNLSEVKNNEST